MSKITDEDRFCQRAYKTMEFFGGLVKPAHFFVGLEDE